MRRRGNGWISVDDEVRGSARTGQHFVALQNVITDADGELALHKCADGTEVGQVGRGRT